MDNMGKIIIQRNPAVDYAKAICLFLILFCHIPMPEGNFHNWIYSFHVPIFFLFAGIFYKAKPLKDVIYSSAKSLLLPYVVFNLILIGISISFGFATSSFSVNKNLIKPLEGVFIGSTDNDSLYHIPGGPSWFLLALFIDRILIIPFIKYKVTVKALYAIGLIGLYLILNQYFSWTIWSIDSALLGLTFMLIGFLCKDLFFRIINLNYKRRLIILICCIAIIPIVLNNGLANMFNGEYGKNFALFILGGISGSLLVILLCSFISSSSRFVTTLLSASTFFICCHIMIMEYVMLIYRKSLQISRELYVIDKIFISLFTITIVFLITIIYHRYRGFFSLKVKHE